MTPAMIIATQARIIRVNEEKFQELKAKNALLTAENEKLQQEVLHYKQELKEMDDRFCQPSLEEEELVEQLDLEEEKATPPQEKPKTKKQKKTTKAIANE